MDDEAPVTVVRPVDLRDYVRFDREAPVRVRVHATDVLTVDLLCLEPGQASGALARPDVDVAYTVVGGNAWFTTSEGEVGLGALGAVVVPSGIAHHVENRTADPLVVLATGAPPDVPVGQLDTDEPVERVDAVVHHPKRRRRARRR